MELLREIAEHEAGLPDSEPPSPEADSGAAPAPPALRLDWTASEGQRAAPETQAAQQAEPGPGPLDAGARRRVQLTRKFTQLRAELSDEPAAPEREQPEHEHGPAPASWDSLRDWDSPPDQPPPPASAPRSSRSRLLPPSSPPPEPSPQPEALEPSADGDQTADVSDEAELSLATSQLEALQAQAMDGLAALQKLKAAGGAPGDAGPAPESGAATTAGGPESDLDDFNAQIALLLQHHAQAQASLQAMETLQDAYADSEHEPEPEPELEPEPEPEPEHEQTRPSAGPPLWLSPPDLRRRVSWEPGASRTPVRLTVSPQADADPDPDDDDLPSARRSDGLVGLGCRERMSTGEYYPLSISHSMPALSTLSELVPPEESELAPTAPALVRTSSSIELSGGALCAILLTVVGGCLSVVPLEMLTTRDRGCGDLISLMEYSWAALISLPALSRRQQIPWHYHLLMLLFGVSYSACCNQALAYALPMPMFLVLKNGLLVANMMVGRVVLGKVYSALQILAVITVTIGLVVCTVAQQMRLDDEARAMQEWSLESVSAWIDDMMSADSAEDGGGGAGGISAEQFLRGVGCMLGALMARSAGSVRQHASDAWRTRLLLSDSGRCCAGGARGRVSETRCACARGDLLEVGAGAAVLRDALGAGWHPRAALVGGAGDVAAGAAGGRGGLRHRAIRHTPRGLDVVADRLGGADPAAVPLSGLLGRGAQRAATRRQLAAPAAEQPVVRVGAGAGGRDPVHPQPARRERGGTCES